MLGARKDKKTLSNEIYMCGYNLVVKLPVLIKSKSYFWALVFEEHCEVAGSKPLS